MGPSGEELRYTCARRGAVGSAKIWFCVAAAPGNSGLAARSADGLERDLGTWGDGISGVRGPPAARRLLRPNRRGRGEHCRRRDAGGSTELGQSVIRETTIKALRVGRVLHPCSASPRANERAAANLGVLTLMPLGRWQETEDIADMVVFLSSERARQVTGQTINVDGGQVMHW